jgi:hypothetical protein
LIPTTRGLRIDRTLADPGAAVFGRRDLIE